MRLLSKDDVPKIHNGDPRKWLPGIYRSQANPKRVVIVVEGIIGHRDERTAIVVTPTGVDTQVCHLGDGYTLLRPGETITIEA